MLSVWLCLIAGAGAWKLGRPTAAGWRWLFVGLVLLLMAGMTLPANLLGQLAEWFSGLWPWSQEPGQFTRSSSPWVHLLLYALVSSWLWHWRSDLGWRRLWVGLGLLAVGTEAVQPLVDGRYASVDDVLMNLLGAALGQCSAQRWWRPATRR